MREVKGGLEMAVVLKRHTLCKIVLFPETIIHRRLRNVPRVNKETCSM